MRIVLAPMEGVVDPLMRQVLTGINQYDLCVTEFIRVVDMLLPKKVFYRLCPELHQGGKTDSGTDVRVQLLGQSPQWLAENAYRAVELGSAGVDLNCGCPSKTVNGSNGGAALLKEPEVIYQAVKGMRGAVPDKPVSVKVRLGWECKLQRLEIADAAYQGGASELTVHGRTRADGYRADRIDWTAISDMNQGIAIPVIANGEIWQLDDAERCLALSGCDDLMLGRGALAMPNLCNVIKLKAEPMPWREVLDLLIRYSGLECRGDKHLYFSNRIKQWLKYVVCSYPEADALFSDIRPCRKTDEILAILDRHQHQWEG
ncbi:tRNA dihydrouridine(16) synthase DusC [Motilimonas sp. 1_MG-2023]|uniref:tRNA dihydrouridine(16) synthase DusC n=1 Tax=Motilimonas sp. 1_MG-2023 TaxID=3062672 RepID=UPI0026E1F105|nr:tRNA dihydrouridine(16) synthase DusC [Motilimonas sp. 1_MG-2023]MDO6525855.1 tRNA dihydrouridine(16) synthase DusC [Motilimonas sp. 1_MG-2023]